MKPKNFEKNPLMCLTALLVGIIFLSYCPVKAQEKPMIQQEDLSNKSLEELWKLTDSPGKALSFVKMNPNDQLAVIISPSLGFGAIKEKGKSGHLSLGYQTDYPAKVSKKGNALTISYRGDAHRKVCQIEMEIYGGKIHAAKASEGCSDYEDGQDHFERDLIGATAILSSSH